MQVKPSPKHPGDPHDILVVAPDAAVRTAPGEDELSKVLRDAARRLSDQQPNAAPEVRAEAPAAPSIPPVDTTFRPTAANDDLRLHGHRPSRGGRVLRGLAAVLVTASMCAAGLAWHTSGDAAKKLVAKWGTQLFLAASSLPGMSTQPASSADQADAANATDSNATDSQASSPAEAAAQAAPPAADPSADQAQLQSMRDQVASLGQQVEQLKATIEQLKAGQQQVSRDVAKTSEKISDPSLRPKKPSVSSSATLPPPRLAAAAPRRPMPPPPYPAYPPPQAAMAPAVSQAPAPYPPQAAPYVPQQIEPAPPTTQTLADPELASVPRPPMPLSR